VFGPSTLRTKLRKRLKLMRIREVVSAKAHQGVLTIAPTATVRELVAMLADNNVGALVVSSDGSAVDGIVSERDIVRRLVGDVGVLELTVAEIMTTTVHTCAPGDGVSELMHQMTELRIRHVPVLEEGSLWGLVSIGDVVKNHIDELAFERDQLEHYVSTSST
jgi:CBS domain-containing protein